MRSPKSLRLGDPPVVPRHAPRDLGVLLDAAQIAAQCYYGKASPRWARQEMMRLLPDRVVVVGKAKCWYEAEVREAIAASRGVA